MSDDPRAMKMPPEPLRRTTRASCMICRTNLGPSAPFEQRQTLAQHRLEHGRQDHRRAGWREAKRRKRERELVPAPVGSLHELACDGRHTRPYPRCRPIPVYERPRVEVVA